MNKKQKTINPLPVEQFVKRVHCFFYDHHWQFIRNIYGDEIIWSGYKRSIWECKNCGKIRYADHLFFDA